MSVWLPAVLAALGVAVAVGLPAPLRVLTSRPEVRGARRRFPASLVGLAVLLALVVPAGPVGAGVAAVLAVLAQRALGARRHAQHRDQERTTAVEAMAVLAAELRAGRAPAVALAHAARVATGNTARGLREAGAATGVGAAAAEILLHHAESSAVPELLRGLAVCWHVCQGSGSSLASAVDRLEEGLRAEQVCREEVEAELAGPRATSALLAVLPALGLLMAGGLGARPVHVLLHTLVGSLCLVLGVALDLLGLWWTRRIVHAAGGRP